MKQKLIEYLAGFITPERNALFDKVLEERTRYLTVVLEDIYQPQNASAVLRSCDCFGVQDVHIIENKNRFQVNPDVTMGSTKWLNLNKYNQEENNTLACINSLKEQGYRIVATTPHTNDVTLEEFDLSKGKAAMVFGTELLGISDVVKENADEFVKIPMYGFTESFNISVSAAIVLHHLRYKLNQVSFDWKLTSEEKNDLKLTWIKRTIKKSELLEKKFLSNEGQ